MATPELRFVDEDGNSYPDWETTRLEEVANIEMGQSPPSSAYNKENMGLPLIQGNADREGRKSQPRVYTKEITKKVFVGDIIMSVRAPAGTVFKSLHNACIGRGVCAISVLDPTLNSQSYLYQKLLTLESEWEKHSQGSTFLSLTGTQIKAFSVFSPSLPEQQKIANLFSLIDEKIENIGKQVYLWKQYKQGLSQQLFSQQLRFVDEEGNSYPDWEEKKLGEILEEKKYQKIEKPQNYPLISNKLNGKGVIFTNNYPKPTKKGRPYYVRSEGEILLGKQNIHNGSINIIPPHEGEYVASNAISSIIIKNGDKGFIVPNLLQKKVLKDFEILASGTGQKEMSIKQFFSYTISLPSLPEQQKIANLLSMIDEKIENLETQENKWKLYKQALMQKMFV